MIKVVLFVDGKHRDTKEIYVVPRIGETIVIDCGEMIKVIEVNHDWSGLDFIQINTVKIEMRAETE